MAPEHDGRGRWEMVVRSRGGSLDTVVQRARWRNLAISGSILTLLLASVFLLFRSSKRAQQLADLQMSFVAGVSHKLRTPLTVIRTAAFAGEGFRESRQGKELRDAGGTRGSETGQLNSTSAAVCECS
jgi:signal transduction histidine kinase